MKTSEILKAIKEVKRENGKDQSFTDGIKQERNRILDLILKNSQNIIVNDSSVVKIVIVERLIDEIKQAR